VVEGRQIKIKKETTGTRERERERERETDRENRREEKRREEKRREGGGVLCGYVVCSD